MGRIELVSPLDGWCAPLAEVPDAVFAQRMLGDGVAIDPTDRELRAPCAGEVISVAAARHAVALRSPHGLEVLMHVGLDTVALGGEGFTAHVKQGERVRAGDLLLSFDLELVARRATSLLTPVIVTNGERFRIATARTGRLLAGGDALLTLEPMASSAVPEASALRAPVHSETVVVRHAHGIHARPAATIARRAKALPFELEIRARGGAADARSAVALMALGIRGGDELVIAGFASGAAPAIAELAAAIRGLDAAPAAAPAVSLDPAPGLPTDPDRPRGVTASRGFAVGPAVRFDTGEISVAERGAGVAHEHAALTRSRDQARAGLMQRAAGASGAARELVEAHLELLDDAQLLAAAAREIAAGRSAGFAWRVALRAGAAALRATGDAHLAQRVDDLADVERYVLRELAGTPHARIELPAGAILLARDLTPSQFMELDAARLGGIALAAGGPTSHVAILAAAQGVPMIVAAGARVLEAPPGARVILDADAAVLSMRPGAAELAAAERTVAAAQTHLAQARERAGAACRLASGERIEVFANLTGAPADATRAVAQGAEGCGLLRTEFLFLDRATPPDEREQLACYRAVAEILGGRPLVIRTLDIGGDKPIPYYPMPREENPALGLRGVRATLRRPDLLETQLRALAATPGDVRILLPMITDPGEIAAVRALIDRVCGSTGRRLPLGAMIETPAAAMLAREIAAAVDFLSIGTNDLSQYALAMDRGHAELAARIDGVHPAVLRLIAETTRGAAPKPVAVCGGLASDPQAAPLLLGLGVTELSAVPAAIPELKQRIARMTLEQCRALARQALAQPGAPQVRALLARVAS
jgi:multiphosphoryl transfer protein